MHNTWENSREQIDYLVGLIDRKGHQEYLGESLSLAQHFLQAATLAVESAFDEETVAAALLHDIGHLRDEQTLSVDFDHENLHHGNIGAQMLSPFFPDAVVEPVRLHVAAKRYLCATEPDYMANLSEASVYSFEHQGGPMTLAEREQFEANPWHKKAIDVRRLDDQAKDPNKPALTITEFVPILERVIRKVETSNR